MANENLDLRELQESIDRLADSLGSLSGSTSAPSTALERLTATANSSAGSEKARQKVLTAAAKKANDGLSALAKAAGAAGSAMYANQKGATAFNSSLDSLSTAATAAGIALMLVSGPIGKIVGALVMMTGAGIKFTKTINEQSDALFKGFQDLSRSGGAASDGMTGLFGDIQKVGLGFQDLESFTRLIGENSRELANFGGSVFRGRQEFAKIGKDMEPFRQGLFNAGMTQLQVNEGTMAYLSLQTRLGRSQSMTVNQLAEGANQYLVELDALTKLTGASAKEIEDQRKAAMVEEQFRAKLRQMELAGDKEGAERLRKYNDLMTAISPELGKGIRALSTGNLAAAEAQQLMLTSSGQAAVDLDRVMAGTLPMADAADKTTAAIGQFSDGIGVNLALLKANDQSFMSFAAQQDIRIAREKGFSETLAKINQDQINQGVTGQAAADKAQQEQTKMRTEQQAAMLALQRMVNIGVEPATTAMSYFATVVASVSRALEKIPFFGPGRQETDAEIKANAELKKHQDEIMALERKRLQSKTNADRKVVDEEIKAARQRARDASQVARQTKKQAEADYDAGKPGGATTGAAQKAAAATGAPAGATTSSQAGSAPAVAGSAGGVNEAEQQMKARNLFNFLGGVSGRESNYNGLDSKFRERLTAMASEYQGLTQKKLDFGSGARSDRENRQVGGVGTSNHLSGKAVDLSTRSVNELASLGLLDKYGFTQNPKSAWHISDNGFADGGIASGPTTGYNALLHGTEAIIPLKNGAVPVSLDMKNAMQPGGIGPTAFGMNEYTGYSQGPMTTDLAAIKSIAAKLGAYDAATKMITDPTTWKQILSSGIATNYNLGMAEIGTKLLPGIGADIGERIQELKSTGSTDTAAAIKQVAGEFKTAMLEAVRNMGGGDPAVAAGQLSALTQLVQEQRNSNDLQKKMLQAAAS
jgi:hypothetical protein